MATKPSKEEKRIEVLTEGVPKELKETIEGGTFVDIPKDKVVGFITIAFVKQNPNPNVPPVLRYEFQNLPQFSIPVLLRKVAKDIEDSIMRTGVV